MSILSYLKLVGHGHGVAMLGHPGDALVHNVNRAVALLKSHLAHLQQHVLAAGRHPELVGWWGACRRVLVMKFHAPGGLFGLAFVFYEN